MREILLGLALGVIPTILIAAAMILWAAPKVDFTEADLCIKSPVEGCVPSPYPGANAVERK